MFRKNFFPLVLLAALVLNSCAAPTAGPASLVPEKRVIGYYAQWAAGRNFFVSSIAAGKITHINYAFANVSDKGECIIGDPAADVERVYTAAESVSGQADSNDAAALHGNFNQLRQLKQKYPQLQTLISVGGWTWSGEFSGAALTADSRRAFAKSCIDLFLKQYKGVFDGLDIDWEYPVGGGLNPGRPEDKQNFSLLLAELRRQLDELGAVENRHYLLTIAAPVGPGNIQNLELAGISKQLDWINLMAYDFHGTWETTTGFNAPLYKTSRDAESTLNGNAAVQRYLKGGVPAEKLVLGVPFYGRGWQGVPSANNGLHQRAAGGAAPGLYENGAFDYKELKDNYFSVYTRFWDDEAQVPWLYNPAAGIFISYDDPESIAAKAGYVKDKGLGGVMIWELSQGDDEMLDAVQQGFRAGGRVHVTPTRDPNAKIIPRPFTQEIHAVSGIEIDGRLDDWPGEPTFTLIDKSQVVYTLEPKSWDGPQDLSARAWAGWGDDGLYFAFDVVDDKHVQAAADVNLWHGDYMELQIDTQLEEDYDNPGMTEDDYQFGISAGDFGNVAPITVAWFGSPAAEQMKKIRQAQVQTATGYVLEIFIPKEVLQGITLSDGAAFGMNINPSDSDGADQEVMMSTSPTRALTDPTTFGKIILVK
jgi:GH18 family chitinase